MTTPRILIVGTVDTKSDEIGFMAEQVVAAGGQPLIMDVGVLGHGRLQPDVANTEVAAAAGEAELALSEARAAANLLVATGRAELMTDGTLSPWDAASLIVMIEEAGGVFTDWQGRATAFGDGAIATNAALAGVCRRALGVPTE